MSDVVQSSVKSSRGPACSSLMDEGHAASQPRKRGSGDDLNVSDFSAHLIQILHPPHLQIDLLNWDGMVFSGGLEVAVAEGVSSEGFQGSLAMLDQMLTTQHWMHGVAEIAPPTAYQSLSAGADVSDSALLRAVDLETLVQEDAQAEALSAAASVMVTSTDNHEGNTDVELKESSTQIEATQRKDGTSQGDETQLSALASTNQAFSVAAMPSLNEAGNANGAVSTIIDETAGIEDRSLNGTVANRIVGSDQLNLTQPESFEFSSQLRPLEEQTNALSEHEKFLKNKAGSNPLDREGVAFVGGGSVELELGARQTNFNDGGAQVVPTVLTSSTSGSREALSSSDYSQLTESGAVSFESSANEFSSSDRDSREGDSGHEKQSALLSSDGGFALPDAVGNDQFNLASHAYQQTARMSTRQLENLAHQTFQQATFATVGSVQKFTMKLTGSEDGGLNIEIEKHVDGQFRVRITAENPETVTRLHQQSSEIADHLKNQGLSLSGFEVGQHDSRLFNQQSGQREQQAFSRQGIGRGEVTQRVPSELENIPGRVNFRA